jgi:long-chain acyl-CoA synthetase
VPTTPIVEVLTRTEAEPKMAAAAGWLLGRGLEPGDRVAFSLDSSADYLCALLGAARVGIIPVVLNTSLLAHERDQLIGDVEPSHQIFNRAGLAELFTGRPAEMSDYLLTRPMHFTSGTTGRPKGVTTGVWDEATARAAFDDEASVWGYGPEDLHMVNSPLYHTVAVRLSSTALLSGGSVAVLSRFDATLALDVLRRLHPTSAFFVPTHLHRLLGLEALGEGERFDSLRLLTHAGAACPPALKRQAIDRVGPDVVIEFYGSTEGQFTLCSTSEWLERPGTVGRARRGRTLSIEPIEGHDAGDPGTIWCSAPEFARFSYFDNPEATQAAWRGAAFSVGDLGSLDDDGYLYLNGRRTDLIITGGVNVYPAEVEAALAEIDGVDQVCVFGRDDEDWGQRVCAAVVARPSVRPETVFDAARQLLAPYKRPKEVHLTSSLPVGSTGKVLRDKVAEHLGLDPSVG